MPLRKYIFDANAIQAGKELIVYRGARWGAKLTAKASEIFIISILRFVEDAGYISTGLPTAGH